MNELDQKKEILRIELFNAVYKAVIENNTAPFIGQLAFDEAIRAVAAFDCKFKKGE